MCKKVYRTAVYVRSAYSCEKRNEGGRNVVSTIPLSRGTLGGNSIFVQERICKKYILQHDDLEYTGTFVDNGYSGCSMERPGWCELERKLRNEEIDAVICSEISRFARECCLVFQYLNGIFPKMGVRFLAVSERYDSLAPYFWKESMKSMPISQRMWAMESSNCK